MNKNTNINRITLVIGGCRSGKSNHALFLANKAVSVEKSCADSQIEAYDNAESDLNDKYGHKNIRKIFMATSVPTDKEMEKRVNKHQKERGEDWCTAEVPIELPLEIKRASADVIIVDCLTLWVSNLLFNGFGEEGIFSKTMELQMALKDLSSSVFLVTNEVGMGIVPENAIAREFRDMAGYVNQKIAETADEVVYMVAGIPWKIKQ
ncbi:CobU [Desulfamplus magnetovallimortis]|uniref:Adenosylcobinamide kinase n=1 Tax=Desulfamplus magnetovallimortis TaxID=1246637 RepID=A0A1W1HD05_9BACT|nr:bifunctional adenosylcobinamide kinase/adenosylcobinamide-phosphate guanylyltransferase [Desulfamplus magnetovallimortis]SLM30255.1 CobU [Desulfamplus magnetovallimortis]